jgi:hypothetical protein
VELVLAVDEAEDFFGDQRINNRRHSFEKVVLFFSDSRLASKRCKSLAKAPSKARLVRKDTSSTMRILIFSTYC